MSQFIEACTQSPVNLALTIALGFVMLYWLVVILGAVGIDSLDFDFDFDADVDGSGNGGIMGAGLGFSVLRFFHVGTVPLLVLMSVFLLTLWAVGVVSYRWIGNWGMVLQLLMLIPFGIGALLLTKLLTLPLQVLFEKIHAQEKAEQHVVLIGKRCNVVSLTADHKHGQVEVETAGSPLRLTVVTHQPDIVLNKGDEAVLVSQDASTGVYTVRGF